MNIRPHYYSPKLPAYFCDPDSPLLKHYRDSVIELKKRNLELIRENDELRDRLHELGIRRFYLTPTGHDLRLIKENKKLRNSLRKMYDKHIKPKQAEITFVAPHGYRLSIAAPNGRELTTDDIKFVSDLLIEALNTNNFILKNENQIH